MSIESHGGMILTGGTPKNSDKNLAQQHFFPPQIPHGLTSSRTRISEAIGRRLTACAIERPYNIPYKKYV
jgi:hypothetical protein